MGFCDSIAFGFDTTTRRVAQPPFYTPQALVSLPIASQSIL